MADGFAQATGKPALLNLHTLAGTGHGMGNIMTAFQNKTPLIITAGQQTREMILGDPYLTNRDETTLPRPWVKWAYQPVTAQDVPGAIMRAYTVAMQPPSGPVYAALSELRPANAILVNETASNFGDPAQYWPINEPSSYYIFASGGLGWGEPAAVGVAIAQKKLRTGRPVIAAIGDGALQYSVQSLYTAAR